MRLLPLLPALLIACNQSTPDGYKPPVNHVTDADADGYSEEEGDCNDQDADIGPTVLEQCDGIDNNCDGQIDEVGRLPYYEDADSDGYGNANAMVEECYAPDGYVSSANDCDDRADDVYPGAPELCNDRDDNCDGQIDEGAARVYYPDNDGDSYGDPASPLEVCTPPAGYVLDGGDCNDQDASIYPGTTEICDGIDQNCDGDIDNDASDAIDWYYDADSDGFGNCSSSVKACVAPSGYVAAPAPEDCDCNDGNTSVNPVALEYCDGIDNDCDGRLDEPDAVGAPTWYADNDADAYGDHNNPTIACNAPAGYVANNTDCDDAQSAANPAAAEICDTIDNNCNGSIDEATAVDAPTWYQDLDSDSYGNPSVSQRSCSQPWAYVADNTDCDDADPTIYPGAWESWYDGIDSNCDGADDPSVCDSTPPDSIVPYDPNCTVAYSNAWTVDTEWTTENTVWASGATYTSVMMTPAIGQLSDDNGDGAIDDLDNPDIVFDAFAGSGYASAGYLRVVSGDDGHELWSVSSVRYNSVNYSLSSTGGVAIGDLEGDGDPDIIALTQDKHPIALNYDGTVKWVSSLTISNLLAYPQIADMNGDGRAEVVFANNVLSSTGSLIFTATNCGTYMNIAADIDASGTMELVCGGVVYRYTGSVMWTGSVTGGRPGVGNFDADAEGEVVEVYSGSIYLFDNNGSLLWSRSSGVSGSGGPTIADIDGDGSPEVIAAFETKVMAVETNGTLKWTQSIYDSTSMGASVSAFDLDGDGAAEVIYADQSDLYIWDGNGNELYHNGDHSSGTLWESPIVADVDRDGNAEIIVPSNDYQYSGWDGIRVLGETGDEWASARMTWNQHAYAPSYIEDDMSVPQNATPFWLDTNTLRANTSWSDDPAGAPDVAALLLGVCQDCQTNLFEVYVSVENTGAVFVPDELPVSLYAVSGTTRTLLATTTVGREIFPGERIAPFTFTIDRNDVGSNGLVVVADDDGTGTGTQNECDENNNDAYWNEPVCP